MNTVKCPGCSQTFDQGIAIKAHQRTCVGLRLVGQKRINKRLQNVQKREAVKHARIEGKSIEDIAEERQDLREDLEINVPSYPSAPQASRSSGQPARTVRLPKRYRDELPPAPPIPIPDLEPITEKTQDSPVEEPEHVQEGPNTFRTDSDSYGTFREYLHGKPSIAPDELYSLAAVSDSPYLATDSSDSPPIDPAFPSPLRTLYKADTSLAQPLFAPFRNASVYRLMTWFYSSSNTKSMSELNSLVNDVILAPDFNPDDLVGFNASKQHQVMDSYQESSVEVPSPFAFDDTWIKGTVELALPCDGIKHQTEADAPKFLVEVYYRKLLDVIKAALSEPAAEKFHIFPFKLFWQSSSGEPEERIYSETYTGDRWNEEYAKVHAANQNGPHHNLEAFLVALMVWSDSTLLAQFGNAQLWPIYIYFGNQSKYSRAKPSSFAAHHVAYMPKVLFLQFLYCDFLILVSA
jgi:Plavaka transposase